MDHLTDLLIFVALALTLDVLIGVLSAPSIVATMIASRAMGPHRALLLSTLAELIGPFLFGVAVANVIGAQVIDIDRVTPVAIQAVLASALVWHLLSYYLRIPTSSSHSLIGGMVGAVVVAAGPGAIHGDGLLKVIISLTLTAPLGMIGGFLMVRFCYWLARNATPRVNHTFNQGQLVVSFGLGLAIGTNEAQRIMGLLALGLVLTRVSDHFEIPTWVTAISALGLALGNLVGGMRVIRTVGMKFFPIRPIHGFSAETASAVIIAVSSMLGGLVSTTHLTNLAVIGAGAAERLSIVRWGFVRYIVIAWLFTIPVTAVLGGLIFVVFRILGAT